MLTGLLTACVLMGCGGFAGAALSGVAFGSAFSPSPTPPKIRCIAEDSMRIKYGTQGSSEARDEAMQIISAHCKHGHFETYRTYHTRTAEVYVACLKSDGVTPMLPSCKYVAPQKMPIGFGSCDPAVEQC